MHIFAKTKVWLCWKLQIAAFARKSSEPMFWFDFFLDKEIKHNWVKWLPCIFIHPNDSVRL